MATEYNNVFLNLPKILREQENYLQKFKLHGNGRSEITHNDANTIKTFSLPHQLLMHKIEQHLREASVLYYPG